MLLKQDKGFHKHKHSKRFTINAMQSIHATINGMYIIYKLDQYVSVISLYIQCHVYIVDQYTIIVFIIDAKHVIITNYLGAFIDKENIYFYKDIVNVSS